MPENHATLYEYWEAFAKQAPNHRLLGNDSRWLTTRETLSLSEHLAARLLSLGVRKGDYVALRAYRTVSSILALCALRAVGAVVVLTDPRHAPEEYLADTDTLIPVSKIVEQTGVMEFTVRTEEKETDIQLLSLPPAFFTPATVSAEEPAFVIFTSGSTGRKKAVVLSESSLISNLLDSEPLGLYSADDIALGSVPVDHVFGLVLLAGTAVLQYALYLPGKTDIPSLLAAIEKEKITRMNGVPSLYLAMCEQKNGYDLSSLRAGFIGGSPVTEEQFVFMENTLGMTLIPVYGMSESIGIACQDGHAPQSVRMHGVGRFYPMNEGLILTEDGRPAPVGTEGEIYVRGPMQMLGYFGQPMNHNEFFRTGDLGYLDENGVLHITGRKKDIIIRNGNNLSPRRIELALQELPGIKAASVVGIPDERQGEVPAALVAGEGTEETILAGLKELLQKNELPVVIRVADELPLTASGKPDKPRIREELIKWRNG